LRPAEPARDTAETPSSPVRPRVEARADTGRADTARADSGSADAASNLVDLNTGTLEQLNSLKGGGRIGRAIINGRPYRNVEDLLRKKVLSRSTYETIKDQVTVR
jgi:DNA uptake protein ComE-like DNA-binding protein